MLVCEIQKSAQCHIDRAKCIILYIYELVLVCEIQKSAQCHIDRAKCIILYIYIYIIFKTRAGVLYQILIKIRNLREVSPP